MSVTCSQTVGPKSTSSWLSSQFWASCFKCVTSWSSRVSASVSSKGWRRPQWPREQQQCSISKGQTTRVKECWKVTADPSGVLWHPLRLPSLGGRDESQLFCLFCGERQVCKCLNNSDLSKPRINVNNKPREHQCYFFLGEDIINHNIVRCSHSRKSKYGRARGTKFGRSSVRRPQRK